MQWLKSNYKKTNKIWINWWKKQPEYAVNTNSDEHIQKSKIIVERYADLLKNCQSFCELGVGTGRNIHFFHERFPKWKYFGNDICPDIHKIIKTLYPNLLDYANIVVDDTLNFLNKCENFDILFTHGHLMHLPDDVIGKVCNLISQKTNKFILIHEAYPHTEGAQLKAEYKKYRFERDYAQMFSSFIKKDIQIEEHPSKGIRHCLYLFEKES